MRFSCKIGYSLQVIGAYAPAVQPNLLNKYLEANKTHAAQVVLPYHPTWNLGTLAAMRCGTLNSLLSEAVFTLTGRKLGESTRPCSVDGFAQSRSVPYLTLS